MKDVPDSRSEFESQLFKTMLRELESRMVREEPVAPDSDAVATMQAVAYGMGEMAELMGWFDDE